MQDAPPLDWQLTSFAGGLPLGLPELAGESRRKWGLS